MRSRLASLGVSSPRTASSMHVARTRTVADVLKKAIACRLFLRMAQIVRLSAVLVTSWGYSTRANMHISANLSSEIMAQDTGCPVLMNDALIRHSSNVSRISLLSNTHRRVRSFPVLAEEKYRFHSSTPGGGQLSNSICKKCQFSISTLSILHCLELCVRGAWEVAAGSARASEQPCCCSGPRRHIW